MRLRSGGTFDLPEGTIYPALHCLEDQGLLNSAWSEDSLPAASASTGQRQRSPGRNREPPARSGRARQALERFGPANIVGTAFEKERQAPMQKVLLAVGLLTGWLIAYVDSRPNWDDTGITAGSMLLISGLLTLLGHKRPWLIALAVGLWTPLYETFVSRDFRFPGVVLLPVAILLICLVGAYAGWAIHLALRKMLRPA